MRRASRRRRGRAAATHLTWIPNGYDKGSHAVSGDYYLSVFFLAARRNPGRLEPHGDRWGWAVNRNHVFIGSGEAALSEIEAKTAAETRWAIDRVNPKKQRRA